MRITSAARDEYTVQQLNKQQQQLKLTYQTMPWGQTIALVLVAVQVMW